MGSSMAKPHSYGIGGRTTSRRRTVPNDNNNNFGKQFWQKDVDGGGPSTSRIIGPEYWLVNSDKQYRDEVFQRNAENVYKQTSAAYHRGPPSAFDSSFSSSLRHHSRAGSSSSPSAARNNSANTGSTCSSSYGGSMASSVGGTPTPMSRQMSTGGSGYAGSYTCTSGFGSANRPYRASPIVTAAVMAPKYVPTCAGL